MFFVTRSFIISYFIPHSGNTNYGGLVPGDAAQRLPQSETEAAQRQSRIIEEGTLPCDGCQYLHT